MRITENKTVDFSNGAKFPICCEWEWTLVVSDPVLCHNLCSALSVVTHILLCCSMGEYLLILSPFHNNALVPFLFFILMFWEQKNGKMLNIYWELTWNLTDSCHKMPYSCTLEPPSANKEDYSPVLLCQTQGGHSEQFPRAAAKRTVKISQ